MIEKKEIELIKEIPIQNVLSKLGIHPFKINNYRAWYFAFNRKEKTASLIVDLHINRFYDHGSGEGGSVIDVVMILKGFRVRDAILYLKEFDRTFTFDGTIVAKPKKIIDSKILISKECELSHNSLLKYIESRRINIGIAKRFCRQIFYTIGAKRYFGIGFSNDDNGFEIRSKHFKGGSSPKTITSIMNGHNQLIIFEGFFDFLSYLTLKPKNELKYDFIILNSTSNHRKISPQIFEKYELVYLMLDNDSAGNKTVNILTEKCNNVCDFSSKYKDFNDLNDFLIFKMNISTTKDLNNEE